MAEGLKEMLIAAIRGDAAVTVEGLAKRVGMAPMWVRQLTKSDGFRETLAKSGVVWHGAEPG